jgi:hypothetical protein
MLSEGVNVRKSLGTSMAYAVQVPVSVYANGSDQGSEWQQNGQRWGYSACSWKGGKSIGD